MTFPGVRDQEIEWLGKGTSSSSYLFLHLPQWQTLLGLTWDGANHLHGHPIPVASFTELPDPLATSKILSTKNEFSGLQANWDGAVCMRMFNKLSYPPEKNHPPNSLLGGGHGRCSPWGCAQEGVTVGQGQSHARNGTNYFTRWMILCPYLAPCLGAVYLSSMDPASFQCTSCGQPWNEALPPEVPPWKSLVG